MVGLDQVCLIAQVLSCKPQTHLDSQTHMQGDVKKREELQECLKVERDPMAGEGGTFQTKDRTHNRPTHLPDSIQSKEPYHLKKKVCFFNPNLRPLQLFRSLRKK